MVRDADPTGIMHGYSGWAYVPGILHSLPVANVVGEYAHPTFLKFQISDFRFQISDFRF
jgi:hypothetical protein